MKIPIKDNAKTYIPIPIRICCPLCRHRGTFEALEKISDIVSELYRFGVRRCPNPDCHSYLFFVYHIITGAIVATYPPERIDFDTTNIPDKVVSCFEEAIACHSEKCYRAAAMMVRRTLEEICHERGATGDNLKKKVESLRDRIIIPKELLDGMDELRLLGNDAAHIESEAFENVGKDEVEAGIEFAKEILKAVYQYSHLLEKLRMLKKKKNSG